LALRNAAGEWSFVGWFSSFMVLMTKKVQTVPLPMRAYSWLAFVSIVVLAGCATSSPPPAHTDVLPQTDASGWTRDEVVDSYIFGYPLVLMTMARTAGNDGHGAVLNTLRDNVPPPASTATTQRTPDVDTVNSTAWLDLSAGPVVLALPNSNGSYLNARVLDMWTNAVWSTAPLADARRGLTKAHTVAFVPPGWAGTLPEGVERVDATGKNLWLSVRIGANGASELKRAKRLQREVRLAPLTAWLADARTAHKVHEMHGEHKKHASEEARNASAEDSLDDAAPATYADTPSAQVAPVAALDAKAFFNCLANALPDNPPVPLDAHALKILADIGVTPGNPTHLPGGAAAGAVAQGVGEAQARIGTPPVNALTANGWFWIGDDLGHYEDDYTLRAFAASTRAGVGTRNDEVVPTARVDSEGRTLDGANRYLVHFPPKELPPARAFWTLTAYTSDGSLGDTVVPRRSIESARGGLRRNRDGSLDILVSSTNPGRAHGANWLPAPSGPFEVVMRLYAPQPEATDGSWQPPALVRQ
jgi:hypothetical protein